MNTGKMACCSVGVRRVSFWRRANNRVRYWFFLNVWCRYLYRPAMRILHRFNLHYAPPTIMSAKYGHRNHWCEWCGLRGETFVSDPNQKIL